MKRPRKIRQRHVVMNGTIRPAGIWRIAGMGPFEWMLSHRPFLRMMEVEFFRSIYTPKPPRNRRREIPGLDRWRRCNWRSAETFRDEDLPF